MFSDRSLSYMEQNLERILRTLKGVYETPEEYTYIAKISFNPLAYKRGQPIDITLNFEDGRTVDAIIDSEYCVEFDILINGEFYDVTVAKIEEAYIVFDYELRNEKEVYDVATSQSLMLPASYDYKVNTKLVFEISGQIGFVIRDCYECSLFSFDDNHLYEKIVIYDDSLTEKNRFDAGTYMKMLVLLHENSLSVLQMRKVDKPSNAHEVAEFRS